MHDDKQVFWVDELIKSPVLDGFYLVRENVVVESEDPSNPVGFGVGYRVFSKNNERFAYFVNHGERILVSGFAVDGKSDLLDLQAGRSLTLTLLKA